MKKKLLKDFYAFIVTAMMFSASANAQIIYTDVNPNMVLSCIFQTNCSPDYSLDLNNDGINDFVLSARKEFVNCGECGPQGGHTMANGDSAVISLTSNCWIADTTGGYALNTLIDSSLGWTNAIHTLVTKRVNCVSCEPSPGAHLVYSPESGPWINVSGNYLPLKIQVGTNFYYGWVKLSVAIGSNTVSITIMEYAYNSHPNQPILAGETSATGINENTLASSMNLFPNPASDELTTDFTLQEPADVQFGLYDIVGNSIVLASEENFAAGPNRKQMNVEQVPPGIYQLAIKTNKSVISRKVIVQH